MDVSLTILVVGEIEETRQNIGHKADITERKPTVTVLRKGELNLSC